MAGYDHYSMSNNARIAYREGLFPISELSRNQLKNHRIDESVSFCQWLVKKGYWKSHEWHHTSKNYNETDFYSLDDLKDFLQDKEIDLIDLKKEYAENLQSKKEEKKEKYRVHGRYIQWSGTRNYPKKETIEFTGYKTGNWIYLDSGIRKQANGNYIKWEYSDEKGKLKGEEDTIKEQIERWGMTEKEAREHLIAVGVIKDRSEKKQNFDMGM